ncbi:MAG: hypothetical protein E4G99_05910 [Anaerolineales bacterium]|nr:MAG: hypothetical protein E4G99_05910 [Anaerolineales bacterium]
MIGVAMSGQTMLDVYRAIVPAPFTATLFNDDDLEKNGQEIDGFIPLGDHRNLLDIIAQEEVTDLIFAILGSLNENMLQA